MSDEGFNLRIVSVNGWHRILFDTKNSHGVTVIPSTYYGDRDNSIYETRFKWLAKRKIREIVGYAGWLKKWENIALGNHCD